ncbi:7,8-didemethyl-8-hydroxy-5-deazariboflavin synthase subunit CofH [Picosynechococcus sp. NKBG15041c]|uniref:7,8-didemethyl-8-hydroxy-5-deazariboflavin synthase subunit CofH n=1 Tax=Picosynechococcus sp. NKBG15041c TaxID=1407650 RepID=UPI000421ACDF|nr:7,8-didemethyl-8-hydroxy-5-deazariboflavin synthase subunit CofH [Picosynechococcus sp. NKBG15041c]
MKLAQVLEKAIALEDLTVAEGIFLLAQTQPSELEEIRSAADQLRKKLCGDRVSYVVNRNLNFTNICEQHCHFCAFRRDEGDEGAFWLDNAQLHEKAADALARGATELCMQGGLNPGAKINGRSLDYYLDLVQSLKSAFPSLHIHAFSPQEIEFIARQDGISFAEVIIALKDAGVGSLPGTAAEVLDDQIRRQICPEKLNTATWLEIVSTAHRLGLHTTSTMLCGHLETPRQQIEHFDQLRSLQQKAIENDYPARITEFILLPFVGQDAPAVLRKKVGRDQPDLAKTLHLTAVSRLFFGQWIFNHQPSWVKLGLSGATEALLWGCNDLGGTLMEEHITSMAGAQGGTCLTVAELRGAIASLGRIPVERNTLYEKLNSPFGSTALMIS